MKRSALVQGLLGWCVVVGTIACGSEPGKQEAAPAQAAPTAPKPKTVAEKVQRYRDCWGYFNMQSWDAFKGCYTDAATSEQLGAGMPTMNGGDAIMGYAKQFATAFPDGGGTLQLILAKDDTVAALVQMNGTHKGPLPGPDGKPVPATNKPIGFQIGHLVRFEPSGDKATHEEAYQDSATMMAQLGLSKMPARPAAAKPMMPPTVAVSSGSETEAKNVEAYRQGTEAFAKHDAKALDAMNAPDMIFHEASQPKDLSGKENIAMLGAFFKAFPDCRLVITSVWGAGDYIVAQGTFEGTNDGPAPMMGIAKATKKAVKVPFIEFSRYENGKVKEDWLIYESMAFVQQLGLM